MATGWYVPRVAEPAERFDPKKVPTSIEDILEFHNVQQYLEHRFLPSAYNEDERNEAKARIPQIRSAAARFFSAIDNTNFAAMVAGVGREYHGALLDLPGRNKAFERCDSVTVLHTLAAAGVHLGELLASKKLVQAYDVEMRMNCVLRLGVPSTSLESTPRTTCEERYIFRRALRQPTLENCSRATKTVKNRTQTMSG